jgi:hypothetical protein
LCAVGLALNAKLQYGEALVLASTVGLQQQQQQQQQAGAL